MIYHTAQIVKATTSYDAWRVGSPVDSIDKARKEAIKALENRRPNMVAKVSIFKGSDRESDSNYCGYVTRTTDAEWIYVIPKRKGQKNCRFGISGPTDSNVYLIHKGTGKLTHQCYFE